MNSVGSYFFTLSLKSIHIIILDVIETGQRDSVDNEGPTQRESHTLEKETVALLLPALKRNLFDAQFFGRGLDDRLDLVEGVWDNPGELTRYARDDHRLEQVLIVTVVARIVDKLVLVVFVSPEVDCPRWNISQHRGCKSLVDTSDPNITEDFIVGEQAASIDLLNTFEVFNRDRYKKSNSIVSDY